MVSAGIAPAISAALSINRARYYPSVADEKPIIDYRGVPTSTSRRRISIPAILCYSAVLTAILYLLLFQTSRREPLMLGGKMPPALKANIDSLAETDTAITTAADGRNVQLHVSLPSDNSAGNLSWFVVRYFSSVYRLYPNRVYVGSDDQIINDANGFFKADHLPSVPWMKEHHVASVFTLSPPRNE
jgi:hypothetical protein